MQINVAQLLKASIGTTREYEVDEILTLDDVSEAGHRVCGSVRLLRTHRGILVAASLKSDLELSCSRCLTPFRQPVCLDFEEEYVPAIDVTTGIPLPPPDDPSIFIINEHHILDLGEAVRQHLLLAVPMKPLCREDCAGLCPHCGQNLNTNACRCPEDKNRPSLVRTGKAQEFIRTELK